MGNNFKRSLRKYLYDNGTVVYKRQEIHFDTSKNERFILRKIQTEKLLIDYKFYLEKRRHPKHINRR